MSRGKSHSKSRHLRTGINLRKYKIIVIIFMIVFAVTGVWAISRSKAAVPTLSIEVEKGRVATPAQTAAGAVASKDGYVQFSQPGVVETWGDHMGVSGELNRTNVDKASSLGLKWIKFSHEYNWGDFDYGLIDYAHSKGMKVIETCQKSPHSYNLSDIPGFTNWCASWVDRGVDAIEIGNEWNHYPFWDSAPNVDYGVQAKIVDAAIKAIRAKSAKVIIITSGFSPESSPNLPQEAIGKLLEGSDGSIKSRATYIGHHPYAYNCTSVLSCNYPERRDWNTFLATQDVRQAATSRGAIQPIVFTEIGGPSGGGQRSQDGVAYSTETQRQLFEEYIAGIQLMRSGGTPIEFFLWHTIRDGESFTNPAEEHFGLFDKDWNIKPAGWVVAGQASKPWQ